MSFEVRFTGEAECRVTEIANWISERSSEGASRWLDALDSAITRLSESADSFGPAPEADFLEEDIREVLFKTKRGNKYRVMFVIRSNVVFILTIRGSGQELLKAGEIDFPD